MEEPLIEFNYELKKPFTYAIKGEVEQAKFITMKAPSSRNMTHIAFLKQAFYRALPKDDTSDSGKETDKEKITGEDIMSIITASNDVDLAPVLVTARELFVSKGIALVDGEEKLTKPLCDDMSPDDFFDIVGEYLANFILASAVQKMNDNLSAK